MERKLYQMPEPKPIKAGVVVRVWTMPTDEEIKAEAKSRRKPWGLLKRDYALKALRNSRDYQVGMGQGRVDAARGLDYSEERFSENYNLGYHEGYTRYHSDRRGWQQWQRDEFDAQYVNC